MLCRGVIFLAGSLALLSVADVAGAQPPPPPGAVAPGGTIPAPRLMFYSLMLGEQPSGVLTWYGMVQPLLEQQRISAERQQQIESLQKRLEALRAAQRDAAAAAQRPPSFAPTPRDSTRVEPGAPPPPRRPAAGYQRYYRRGPR